MKTILYIWATATAIFGLYFLVKLLAQLNVTLNIMGV